MKPQPSVSEKVKDQGVKALRPLGSHRDGGGQPRDLALEILVSWVGAGPSAESMADGGRWGKLPQFLGRSQAMRGAEDGNCELMGPVGQVIWLFLASQDSRQPRIKTIIYSLTLNES